MRRTKVMLTAMLSAIVLTGGVAFATPVLMNGETPSAQCVGGAPDPDGNLTLECNIPMPPPATVTTTETQTTTLPPVTATETVTETVTYTPPPPPGWTLVWVDEFTGTTYDSTKWTARVEGRDASQFASCDRAENVKVQQGELHLIAKRETANCAGGTRQYTTGALWTDGKFAAPTNGAIEIRAMFPGGATAETAQGLWIAGWTRAVSGWGEMDLFEAGGGLNRWAKAIQAVHHDYSAGGYGQRWVERISGQLTPDWHVFRVEWNSDGAKFYIDGTLTFQTYTCSPWQQSGISACTPWMSDALDGDHHIRLSFQIPSAGMAPYYGDASQNPLIDEPGESVTFRVDYVRVYEREQ